MEGKLLGSLDAVLSMVQMPGGVPVGTLAVGSAGAQNAALLAVRILANSRPELRQRLRDYHAKMVDQIRREAEL
jgi:5-(carboxyamino)imidazole ribonucleotide mutase